MSRFLLASICLVACLAGCLAAAPQEDSANLAIVPQAGCDQPVWPGIRGREPDIAADPANPDRLAAAAMVSVPSLRPLAPRDLATWTAVARSSDGGATWIGDDLDGWPGDGQVTPFTGSVLVGDPLVAFLPDGTLLLIGLQLRPEGNLDLFAARFEGEALQPTALTNIARGGYGDPALAQVPGTYQLFYNDKPELAVDPDTGDVYVGWMWRTNGASGSRAVPVVSMSSDGGRTWAPPVLLLGGLGAGAFADTFGPAVPFVAGGRVHALWWDQVAGELWQADALAGTLDFGPGRLVRPTTTAFGGGKGVLASGLVQAAVHPDGQEVAVTWSQEGDGFDAVVIRSIDAGATWGEPVAVGRLPGDQLLPTVAYAPDGTLGVLVLDNSDGPQGTTFRARLWASHSGQDVVVDLAGEPMDATVGGDDGQSVGDYQGLFPTADGLVAAWQDARDGTEAAPFSTIHACRVAFTLTPAAQASGLRP